MKVLLDTSVIIDVLRHKRDRHSQLRELRQAGHILACSAINVAEVYAGMRPQEADATYEFLDGLECIEISGEVAQRAGRLKYEWKQKGITLDLPDAIIAAVAITFDLEFATDNRKDFPMLLRGGS